MNRTQALKQSAFDAQQWQKLYYRHAQQYIRKRLDAIKLLMDGQSRTQVAQQLNCRYDTLTSWIDAYLTGGLAQLVVAITHNKPSLLTLEQQQQLKTMLLTQYPSEYGIDRQIWTGAISAPKCSSNAGEFSLKIPAFTRFWMTWDCLINGDIVTMPMLTHISNSNGSRQ